MRILIALLAALLCHGTVAAQGLTRVMSGYAAISGPHAAASFTSPQRRKNPVHGSTGSPRTGRRNVNSTYLAVRPERVEGRSAIFSHDQRLRGEISESYCNSETQSSHKDQQHKIFDAAIGRRGGNPKALPT
jgi:hypothetical protein